MCQGLLQLPLFSLQIFDLLGFLSRSLQRCLALLLQLLHGGVENTAAAATPLLLLNQSINQSLTQKLLLCSFWMMMMVSLQEFSCIWTLSPHTSCPDLVWNMWLSYARKNSKGFSFSPMRRRAAWSFTMNRWSSINECQSSWLHPLNILCSILWLMKVCDLCCCVCFYEGSFSK